MKRLLLLLLSIFCINAVYACSVNISVHYGINGHVTFNASSTGGDVYGDQFTWNLGDGSGNKNMGYDSTLSYVYTTNGTYKVSVQFQVDSSPTCSSTDTISINITNITTPCTLSTSYTYTVNAAGQVNFTSTSTGTNANTLYYWNPGDGSPTIQALSNYSHTYTYQGGYYVWLYTKDTGAAYCIDSTYQYIAVYTADSNECHLKANFTYTVGVNGHVTFTNTSTSLNSSLNSNWTFGDGGTNFTGNTTDTHIYTANGTYTVSLVTYADTINCQDSTTETISITNVTTPCTLSASFTSSNDTTTGMVYVSSTSTGTYAGTQYTWKVDSTVVASGSSANLTFPSNGTYTVWLITRNTGSAYCVDSISEGINVSNVDPLVASFTSTNIGDTVGEYLYIFNSTTTGANGVTEYRWDAGDTTGADSGVGMTSYSHYYKYTGIHTATLSVWFTQYPSVLHPNTVGVGNRYDFSTYSVTIDVEPAGIAVISNPNADIKLYPNPNNGSFKLNITGIESNQDAQLQITNLLGEVIYQTAARSSNGMIQQDVNLQSINSGTYFVRIITANKVYNTKTVITR